MAETVSLKVWGPAGERFQVELPAGSDILPRLTGWAKALGCRVGDLDYQIDGGMRVLGEASAQAHRIDVCGLPRFS